MKVLTATTVETARYRGTNGTYASVKPTTSTQLVMAQILGALRQMGYTPLHPADVHVTVVYAAKDNLSPEQMDEILKDPLYSTEQEHRATKIGFTHWPGHDEDGYLVLKINAPTLAKLHHDLRKKYGLTVSFPEYEAHVTIINNAYKTNTPEEIQKLCDQLNALPMQELTFAGLRFEDAD